MRQGGRNIAPRIFLISNFEFPSPYGGSMLRTYTITGQGRHRLRHFTPIDGDMPHRVALKLHHTLCTEQVYWSVQGNSYVVSDGPLGYWTTPDGKPCDLLSINGHGEIRWCVTAENGNTSGDTDAAHYFGLMWHGYRGR